MNYSIFNPFIFLVHAIKLLMKKHRKPNFVKHFIKTGSSASFSAMTYNFLDKTIS